MQTFLTRKKHMATAADLDMPRLGKQRAEAWQILQHLLYDGPMVGNIHAYNMWIGWEGHLAFYGMCMAHEWGARGFHDNTLSKFKRVVDEYPDYLEHPLWCEDLWVLRSHRSRLVEKAPHIYGDLFPNTPVNMPYLWPVNDEKGGYYLRLSNADVHRVETGERALPAALVLLDEGRIEVDDSLAMDHGGSSRLVRGGSIGRTSTW